MKLGEAAARIIPAILVVFVAYTMGIHALRVLGPGAPPLSSLASMSMAGFRGDMLAYYAIAALMVAGMVAAGYYTFTIGSTHRTVLILGFFPLASASLGVLRIDDVLLMASTSLVLLYLYPYRRKYVVEEKHPAAKIKSSIINPVSTVSIYVLPPLLALAGSAAVSSAIEFVVGMKLGLPPPLPDIWSLFSATRLAYMLVAVLVTAAVLWVLGELAEGLLLFFTLTPRDARDRALSAVREEWRSLEEWRTWHQRIMVWSASTLAGILAYPIIYSVLWRLVARAGGTLPGWVLLAADLGAAIVVWRLFHTYVGRIVVHRGGTRGSAPILLPLIIVAAYVASAMLGLLSLQPVYYALGLKPPSSSGDMLSGIWSDEALRRSLEGMFKEFERIARIIVKLLWG